MSKLDLIAQECIAKVPGLTHAQVESFVFADWPEGQEHLDWVENAPVAEIVSWVLASGFWEVE